MCRRGNPLHASTPTHSNFPETGIIESGFDKIPEKRMRIHWTGFEFRMKLTSQKPGMLLQLNDFDQIAMRGDTADLETFFLQAGLKLVVEFVAVTVAF